MADVTISSLTPGTPAGSNMVPYSNGSVTLGAPVSAMFQNTDHIGINMATGLLPNAWSPNMAVLQLGGSSCIWSDTAAGLRTFYGTNYYYDGTNRKYIAAGAATEYLQAVDGAHVWYNAPAGAAAATVTFNERMRIAATGNVGIGTVSPVSKLHVDGTITANIMSCSAIDSASQSWQVASDGISIFANTNFKVDIGTYDVHFRANVNACGGPYMDNYYGKIYIGVGYDYSTPNAVRYIGWQQISVSPRTFADSGGGNLSAAAVMYNPATGTEYTKIVSNSGLMDNLRIKFKVSGFVWTTTTCIPPYAAANSDAVIKIRKVL